mmetsp:Transcript_38370/g.83042  ORF Transcript_38370/g.83042 Transcript_38370/m.83042 type:complete len:525 (-) Transcript_38370:36-1610(-)|eukprot:CAMPEP_0206541328 /NCGR_PEP_ID=MMETSP0325_2-20121206/9546_1 /ASSEMBLY_ACC=CAM_ASM_000347 /TAXON_ID=2866 /ORGANISM="Crypthecodinium cohnii, Strain Seligo" /LENGTH=524 /DNA_ID=CAMNT_0054039243 /DNA_START=159 /DNA_END=1733 /DNA_ORIENTATION=-
MPILRAGDWVYRPNEVPATEKDPKAKAENKPGHRSIETYKLPKWVYHPETPGPRIVIKKEDFYGLAADGNRNYANWNVAHVAALHDDLKLLSLATHEQCKEPNKWGMTPTHMCAMGQHPYGPSLAVLYELTLIGAADPQAVNHADQTPWHVCQRMHKPVNLKKFEKVLLTGKKPDHYDQLKETQLRLRGKFAHPAGWVPTPAEALEDEQKILPTCLVFPGQGSQYVGMLKGVQDLPAVQTMLAKANEILGYDLLDLMLNGPEDKLEKTMYCQPAMYVAGLAAVEQLKLEDPEQAEHFQALAGLSLGEYTALTLAGVMDFEVGLKVVKARGEAMDYETTREGAPMQGMLSIAGLPEEKVNELCEATIAGKPGEVCQIANYLFPKGFSVAGTKDAIHELKDKADEAGALQAKVLKTSGAFHTPVMAGAKQRLLEALNSVKDSMKPPSCQVYMNTTAEPIGPQTSVEEIVTLLGEQLVSPVRWDQSMQRAIQDGCTKFIECGPHKQLKAMMKRIHPKTFEKMTNVPV